MSFFLFCYVFFFGFGVCVFFIIRYYDFEFHYIGYYVKVGRGSGEALSEQASPTHSTKVFPCNVCSYQKQFPIQCIYWSKLTFLMRPRHTQIHTG